MFNLIFNGLNLITVHNSSSGKVMFSQVSVCPRGEVYEAGTHPTPLWQTDTPLAGRHPLWRADTPGRHTPPRVDTPGQTHPPPSTGLLQRTVRILLECILVSHKISFISCGKVSKKSRLYESLINSMKFLFKKKQVIRKIFLAFF